MSEETIDEREHMLRCSTCGKRAQTGFKKHESGALHWNTVKAGELRTGDVVRPAVGNLSVRVTHVYKEEYENEPYVVVMLSTGFVMVARADDDVPLMLREQWQWA